MSSRILNLTAGQTLPQSIAIGPFDVTKPHAEIRTAHFTFTVDKPASNDNPLSTDERNAFINPDLFAIRITADQVADKGTIQDSNNKSYFYIYASNIYDHAPYDGVNNQNNGFKNLVIADDANVFTVNFDLETWSDSWAFTYAALHPFVADNEYVIADKLLLDKPLQVISGVQFWNPPADPHTIQMEFQFGGSKWITTIPNIIIQHRGVDSAQGYKILTSTNTGATWASQAEQIIINPTTQFNIDDTSYNQDASKPTAIAIVNKYLEYYFLTPHVDVNEIAYVRDLNLAVDWTVDSIHYYGLSSAAHPNPYNLDAYAIQVVESTVNGVTINGAQNQNPIPLNTSRVLNFSVPTPNPGPGVWAISQHCNYRGQAYSLDSFPLGITKGTGTSTASNALTIDAHYFKIGTTYFEVTVTNANSEIIARTLFRLIVSHPNDGGSTTDLIDGQAQPVTMAQLVALGKTSFGNPYSVVMKKWASADSSDHELEVGTVNLWVENSNSLNYGGVNGFGWSSDAFTTETEHSGDLDYILCIQFKPKITANVTFRITPPELVTQTLKFSFNSATACNTLVGLTDVYSTITSTSPQTLVFDTNPHVFYFQAQNGTGSQKIGDLSLFTDPSTNWGIKYSLHTPDPNNAGHLTAGVYQDLPASHIILPPSGIGAGTWYYSIKVTPGNISHPISGPIYVGCEVANQTNCITINIIDGRNTSDPYVQFPTGEYFGTVPSPPSTPPTPDKPFIFSPIVFNYGNLTIGTHKLRLTLKRPHQSNIDPTPDPDYISYRDACATTSLTCLKTTGPQALYLTPDGSTDKFILVTSGGVGGMELALSTALLPIGTDVYYLRFEVLDGASTVISTSDCTFYLKYNATPADTTVLSVAPNFNSNNGGPELKTFLLPTNPITGNSPFAIPYGTTLQNIIEVVLKRNSLPLDPRNSPYYDLYIAQQKSSRLFLSDDTTINPDYKSPDTYVLFSSRNFLNQGPENLPNPTILSSGNIQFTGPNVSRYKGANTGTGADTGLRDRFWIKYVNRADNTDATAPLNIILVPSCSLGDNNYLNSATGSDGYFSMFLNMFVQGEPTALTNTYIEHRSLYGCPLGVFVQQNDTNKVKFIDSVFDSVSNINVVKYTLTDTVAGVTNKPLEIVYQDPVDNTNAIFLWNRPLLLTDTACPLVEVANNDTTLAQNNTPHQLYYVNFASNSITFTFKNIHPAGSNPFDVAFLFRIDSGQYAGQYDTVLWSPSELNGKTSGTIITKLSDIIGTDANGNNKIPSTVKQVLAVVCNNYVGSYNIPDLHGLADKVYLQENTVAVINIGVCANDLSILTSPAIETTSVVGMAATLLTAIENQQYTPTLKVTDVNNVILSLNWKITKVVPYQIGPPYQINTADSTWTTSGSPIDLTYSTASTIFRSKYGIYLPPNPLDGNFTFDGLIKSSTEVPNGDEDLLITFEISDPNGKCNIFNALLPIRSKPPATLTITPSTVNDINLCDLYAVNTVAFQVFNPSAQVIQPKDFKITEVLYGPTLVDYPGANPKQFCYDSGLDIRAASSNGTSWVFGTIGDLPIANGLATVKDSSNQIIFAAGTTVPLQIQATATYQDGTTLRYGYLVLNLKVVAPSSAFTPTGIYSTVNTDTPHITKHVNKTNRPLPDGTPTNIQACGYTNEGIELTFAFNSTRVKLSDYQLYAVIGLGTPSQRYVPASPSEVLYTTSTADSTKSAIVFTPKTGGNITLNIAPTGGAYNDVALVVRVPSTTKTSTAGSYGRDISCIYGYFSSDSPSILRPNYRYFGAPVYITVNDAYASLNYPTTAAMNLTASHEAPVSGNYILNIQYERQLFQADGADATYTAISAPINATYSNNNISYILPNVIFDSDTITTIDPTEVYRITFNTASGSVHANLIIQPTGTNILIVPSGQTTATDCNTKVAAGAPYSQTYQVLCNICTANNINSVTWSLVSSLPTNAGFRLDKTTGSVVTISTSGNVLTGTTYTYILQAKIPLPKGSIRTLSYTCTFIGTNSFDIQCPDNLSTNVGDNFGYQLKYIHGDCVAGTPSVTWTLNSSGTQPTKYPTGLGLTITPNGLLSWMPVLLDNASVDNPKFYPYTYVVNINATLKCGSDTVNKVNKDVAILVHASTIHLTSMVPASGFYNTANFVNFIGTNFVSGIQVFFDDMQGEVTFLNSSLLQVRTPLVPEPDAEIDKVSIVSMVNPDGGTLSPSQEPHYTFKAQLSPALTGITPASGTPLGWTKVTIIGRNFEPFSKVYMSLGSESDPSTDILQPIIYITPQQVVFLTMPHAAGVVKVRITNRAAPDGQISYVFKDGPTITDVTPSIVSSEGDTITVYITGNNFYGDENQPRVFIDDFEIPAEKIIIIQN